ncbi:hypothetical protein ACQYWQ_28625 [Streptomyces sp. P6-2-1]|uniref:hypothetical protein n=1 Tax=Streptomyces sp. P6-2-1 TaxID=3422591 RepID=UPI003D365F64
MAAFAVSVVAVLVSLASLGIAYSSGRRARMPVLQFMWGNGPGGGTTRPVWWLVNVGTGPATNVVVAQAERTALTRGLKGEEWFNPVLVAPVPAGGRLPLSWLDARQGGLGASYTDAEKHFYTTKCGDDLSMFFVGLHLPRWPLLRFNGGKVVRTWWHVADDPAPRWSAADVSHVRRRWWLPHRFGISRRLGGWADPVRTYRAQ